MLRSSSPPVALDVNMEAHGMGAFLLASGSGGWELVLVAVGELSRAITISPADLITSIRSRLSGRIMSLVSRLPVYPVMLCSRAAVIRDTLCELVFGTYYVLPINIVPHRKFESLKPHLKRVPFSSPGLVVRACHPCFGGAGVDSGSN